MVLPAGWVAVELAREFGVPVVISEHSGPFAMHLTTPKLIRLVHDILAGADRLAAVSPSLRDAMNAVCPAAAIERFSAGFSVLEFFLGNSYGYAIR